MNIIPSLRSRLPQWREFPHYFSSFLVLTAQRNALLKPCATLLMETRVFQGLLQFSIPAGITLVGTHSLSGATTEVSPAAGSKNPASGQVGTTFTWFFTTTGAHRAQSFTVSGLPAGLTYKYGSPVSSITGKPTAGGTSKVTIKGWENSNKTGASTPVYTLTINVTSPPPVITALSSGGEYPTGTPVNLSVTATGLNLTYQWKRDGTAIDGATASTYAIPALSAATAGTYTVVVTSGGASVTSNPIGLTVAPDSLAITSLSPGGEYAPGTPVSLTVAATGANPTYQWKRNGVDIGGATSNVYEIAALAAESAGSYTVVVSSGASSVTSGEIVISLIPAIDLWKATYWQGPGLLDPAVSGPDADPDGDGLANALEYVLDLNPTTVSPDTAGLYGPDPYDEQYFQYTVPLNPDATDFTVRFQQSVDLASGLWETIDETDPAFQVIRTPTQLSMRVLKTGTQRFVRLISSVK